MLVVNKADRDGADRAMADLTTMLGMACVPVRGRQRRRASRRRCVRASAATGAGVGDIMTAIERSRAAPAAERVARRRRQAVRQVTALVGEQARPRRAPRSAPTTRRARWPRRIDRGGRAQARSLERGRGSDAGNRVTGEVILWNHAQTSSSRRCSSSEPALRVGCGLISSDVAEIKFNLPPPHVQLQFVELRRAGGALAGDPVRRPASVTDCCNPTPPLPRPIARRRRSRASRTRTGWTSAWRRRRSRRARRSNLGQEVQQLSGLTGLVSISIKRISYQVTANTLDVDVPDVILYLAPSGVMDPNDPSAKKFGTLPAIPAMTSIRVTSSSNRTRPRCSSGSRRTSSRRSCSSPRRRSRSRTRPPARST